MALKSLRNPGGNGVFLDKEKALPALLGARPRRVVHRGKAMALLFDPYALHFRFGM